MSRISNDQAAPVYCERDLIVVCALASGATMKETAALIGISTKGLEFWTRSRAYIRPAVVMIASILRTTRLQIRREAIDDYMGEIKKRDSTALAALDRALEGQDPRLAYEASREQRDRRLGAPRSSVKLESKVQHTHIMEIPKEVLELMKADLIRDRELYECADRLKITGEVIE